MDISPELFMMSLSLSRDKRKGEGAGLPDNKAAGEGTGLSAAGETGDGSGLSGDEGQRGYCKASDESGEEDDYRSGSSSEREAVRRAPDATILDPPPFTPSQVNHLLHRNAQIPIQTRGGWRF
jgi:hypothetical protein